MSRPRLCLLGLSHKTAPVALRERMAFRAEDIPRALRRLIGAEHCREAVILSTCNRVELYGVGIAPDEGLGKRLRAFLAEFHGVPEAEMSTALYERHDADAAEHLFEVAASIDSQILGETEILAQAKEAFRLAGEAEAVGPVLRAAFERAFHMAKEIRAETGIGKSHASVSSAAVQLVQKVFDDFASHQVLLIGTGEMAQGIVRALRELGAQELWVASRTLERAEAFAHTEGGKACQISDLPAYLARVDIVLVSTAAPYFVIRHEHLKDALPKRHGRPLFVIDISVPRNVDPESNKLNDVFLYDIDDLEEVAREGRAQREQAAALSRPRLADEARLLFNELVLVQPGMTAKQLLAQAEALRKEELAKLGGAGLNEAALKELERALERFQGRLLHAPLAVLKEAARQGDGEEAAQWIARLFRLQIEAAKEDMKSEANPATPPSRPLPIPAPERKEA